jgi:HEAT repeat protein
VAAAGDVEPLVFPQPDLAALRSRGERVMGELAELYERSDPEGRATIASVYYRLGWRSADARRVLLADLDTPHERLRLQVQWALGRVSDDLEVVDRLVEVMRRDGTPLFRDKAACALAHDQVHLTERQKAHLYQRLIEALEDANPQVRSIAAKALEVHTGTRRSVEAWKKWLEEYRAAL